MLTRRIAHGRPLAAWLLVIACATGCQTVSIKRVGRSLEPAYRGPMAPAAGWPAARPTPEGAEDLPAPLAAMPGAGAADSEDLLARAEANRRAGLQSFGTSREVAARFELIAVREAIAALGAARSDPSASPEPARGVYAAAVRDFLRDSSRDRLRLDRKWEAHLASQGFRVRFDPDASTWTPDRFDEFLVTTDWKVDGLQHQYKYDGLGVPLIGIRHFRLGELDGKQGEAKFLMPRQVYPVTAVLRPEGGATRGDGDGVERAALRREGPTTPAAVPGPPPESYVLELHDPIVERRVEFAGRSEPLAADLTTSLTYHFAHSPLPILQEIGLLDPQWLEKLAGLYMIHPYIPGRIPIIFVHGLRSSPAAWLQVMNEMRGDPELRDRYQVWLFMYPTGTPFPYSAAKLRAQLDELRAVVDPEHADHTLDRAVLVGHSMGGLITRLTISSSGEALWKLVSERPFEELRASPERKEMLRNVFFFEPHPMIARAVFIATPHRGSELGDQFVGRLADRLIRLPSSLRQTYRALLIQNGRDFFTPEVRSGLPSSIDELRRDNRLLRAMSNLPTRPGLEAHSVIGRKDPADPIPESTDGVVPYASSHVDWAVSEKVVAGDHGCQDEPATIEELRRILTLHLGRSAAGAGSGDPEVVRASAAAADAPVADRPAPEARSTPRPRARVVAPPGDGAAGRGWRPAPR